MTRAGKRDPWLPQRLENMLRVNAAEQQIEAATRLMLAAWLPAARAAVLGHHDSFTAAAAPDPDRIGRADATLQAAIRQFLRPAIGDVFGARFAQIARDAAISDQRYREAYVDRMTLRITSISHTTREQIADLVRYGIANGASMDAIAEAIDAALTLDGPAPRFTLFSAMARDDEEVSAREIRRLTSVPLDGRDAQWREQLDAVKQLRAKARNQAAAAKEAALEPRVGRALQIARTEVMGALNGGTLAGMQARADAFGVPMKKRWLSAHDSRTRPSHAAADGQTVDLDQPFTVGGHLLQHPADPMGAAAEVISCRCCMLEVTEAEATVNPRTGLPVKPGVGVPDQITAAAPRTVRVSTTTSEPLGVIVPARFRGRITEFTAPVDTAPAVDPAAPTVGEAGPDGLTPFTSVLTVEGSPTGDGRQFEPGSLSWRQLPLPLMWQPVTGEWGHSGSSPVGRIDTIERDGALIRSTGFILPPNPADPDDPIQGLLTLLRNGVRVGPSVDLDDMVIEFPDLPEGEDYAADMPEVAMVTAGRIIAATVVATPAFAEVAIQLGTEPVAVSLTTDPTSQPSGGPTGAIPATPNDGPAGAATAAAPPADPAADPVETDGVARADGAVIAVGDDVLAIIGDGDTQRPVEATVTAIDATAGTVDLTLLDGTSENGVLVDNVWPDPDEASVPAVAAAGLVAAAPVAPPRAWFEDPHLAGPTALTIDDDGRVYGHLATWGTCHTGFPDTCVTAPIEDSYDYFTVGEVLTADGDRVPTGRVTLGGGHADPKGGYRFAVEHYDNAGACAADVAAGSDEYGIWLAGAARSDLTDEQLRAFRAAPLSGDWRRIKGQLRLMGALAVNLPGFPIPRPKIANVGGVQVSLAAAGVLHPSARPVGQLTAAGVADEVRAVMGRKRRADRLARQIGRDSKSRVAALVASVKGDQS